VYGTGEERDDRSGKGRICEEAEAQIQSEDITQPWEKGESGSKAHMNGQFWKERCRALRAQQRRGKRGLSLSQEEGEVDEG